MFYAVLVPKNQQQQQKEKRNKEKVSLLLILKTDNSFHHFPPSVRNGIFSFLLESFSASWGSDLLFSCISVSAKKKDFGALVRDRS